MILGMIHFVRGWVRLKITSPGMERFLNLCAARNIDFWDVRRVSPDTILATVSVRGFFELHPFARRTMSRIRVIRKRGAPFLVRRYRRRWGLWAGALLCAAAIWAATGFVWTIDVTGCETISEAELRVQLAECGLEPGVALKSIRPDRIKNEIMSVRDDLSFFAVNLKGTKAEVIVSERENDARILLKTEPCDIVSDKTGVLSKVEVYEGNKLVKEGQTIHAGDKIASGIMRSSQGDVWQVHARAQAEVRTWYTLETVMDLSLRAPRKTGAKRTRMALIIGERRLNLYLVENAPFTWYDKTVKKKSLELPGGFELPVCLVCETLEETQPEEVAVVEEKCSSLLEERLREAFVRSAPEAQIVSTNFVFQMENGMARGILNLECLELTGVEAALTP